MQLIPPGARRNKHWTARGSVEGRLVERSLGPDVRTKADAQRAARALELRLQGAPRPGAPLTFDQACELFAAFKQQSPQNLAWLNRLRRILGPKRVDAIRQVDLVEAARALYGPAAHPATMNRAVIQRGAAVLHYAAENGYCPYLRLKGFHEAPATTRALAPELAATLIRRAAGAQRLFLIWSFGQGTRVSDTLRLRWEMLDLGAGTATFTVAKTGRERTFALHPDVTDALRAAGPGAGAGYVFPWRDRTGVYHWLRPYCAALGIRFTPHMARHTLGTALNASGAGLRTIMEALGHDSVRSSMRYQSANVDVVRGALSRAIPKLGG